MLTVIARASEFKLFGFIRTGIMRINGRFGFACVGFLLLFAAGCWQHAQPQTKQKVEQVRNAVDLRAKAIRIEKEPSYESSPMYALLVFGSDASKQHWLVVDDKTV